MEYVLTIEEVETLEQTTLDELEIELYYQLFLENQKATFVA